MNRTLYHTKINGVGVVHGWCECVDEQSKPCKIIRDILDIKKHGGFGLGIGGQTPPNKIQNGPDI